MYEFRQRRTDMDVRVIIIYSDELEAIMVDDMKMEDISVIQEKQINEWFYPSNGRDGWEGLIKEIQKMIADENANLKFEFQGPEEYKKVFSSCIEKLGYGIECMKDEEIASFHTEEAKKDEHRGLYKEAIKHYYLGADVGKSAECQFKVAEYYLKHYLGEIDLGEVDKETAIKNVIEYYEKAAENGNAEAGYCLYKIFSSDENSCEPVKKDDEQAIYWLQKAAYLGYVKAQIKFGEYIEKSQDNKSQYEKNKEAFEWYKKAAQQKNDDAYMKIAESYALGKGIKEDKGKAFEWYERAAREGNVRGEFQVAECYYYYGRGVNQDYKKAFDLYKDLADKKQPDAYFKLALCYDHGYGVQENQENAFKWYLKAAEAGYEDAFIEVGQRYDSGKGVLQNTEEFIRWYAKAAESGNTEAQMLMGAVYLSGEFREKDIDKAKNYLTLAAEGGNTEAQIILGGIYETGEYWEKDWNLAYKWYEKSAKLGDASGQTDLGRCFQLGIGVAIDNAAAMEWYNRAIANGSSRAMYMKGRCYEVGRGVEKNNQTAFEWYKKAADADEPDADACYKIAQEYYKNIDTDTKVLGRTGALVALSVLVPVTNFVTIPAALLGSGMVGESKKKKFVQTEAGKEMMKYYHRAADLGHAEAKKKVEELKDYEK